MRKKYLSALLFGALVMASTATFTSCKDYDDDIENLQGQINTVVSDLASLKSQIATQYVQSVTFNEQTGELVVTTMASGSSSSKTYTVKTSAGTGEVADIKVEIKGQDLVVNDKVIGKVGDTVTVNDNGELTINGIATGIKVGKYAILTDQSQGTVTIQIPNAKGEMETVTLLTSAAALTSVQIQDFWATIQGADDSGTNAKIRYGLSGTNVNWAGPKGNVTRNQLLVGQISTFDVQVTPADYDLGAQTLTLQNSLGKTINVNVTATPNNMLLTRAASKSGSWTLSFEMNDKVTVDNIANVFGGDDVLYSLCVNGKPFTTFDILGEVHDNRETNAVLNTANLVNNLKYVSGGTWKNVTAAGLPLGTTTDLTAVFATAENINLMYDSYITFEGTEAEKAQAYGITANGMSITTDSKAAGVTITATVHTLSVTGNTATSTVTFKVANSGAAAQTIATTTYTLAPARTVAELLKPIVIDLGDVFTKMDVATLEKVKKAGQLSLSGFGGNFLVGNPGALTSSGVMGTKVSFLKADNTAWSSGNFISATTDLADGLLSLKYIKLDPTAIKLNKNAKPGTYNLTLAAVDEAQADPTNPINQILKVTIPVEIKVPAFTDMFAKNYETANFEAHITPTTVGGVTAWSGTNPGANAGLTLSTGFKIAGTTYNPDASKLAFAFETFKDGKYPVTNLDMAYNGVAHNAIDGTQTVALLDKNLFFNETRNGLVADTDIKNMIAYYSVLDIVRTSDVAASCTADELKILKENFTVTSDKYTTTVKSALDGIKLVYYVDDVAMDLSSYEVTLQTNETIKPYANKTGLALVLGNDKVPVGWSQKDSATLPGYGYDNALAGYYNIVESGMSTTKNVMSTIKTSKGNASWTSVSATQSAYKVTGLLSGETATVTITLTDASGIQYPMTLRVKK